MTAPDGRAAAGMTRTIPALPVLDVPAAVAFYGERLGFEARHATGGFAVLARDDAVVHLWSADDLGWRQRGDLGSRPVRSGAESFLAGTASCRIEVADVDGLFEELRFQDVLHPTAGSAPATTDFGTREFPVLDLDGNLLAFFLWLRP